MIAEDEIIKELSSALQTWLTIISTSLDIFATIQNLLKFYFEIIEFLF